MKIFVAGATGAIGKQLLPRLLAKGHEVVGMAHSSSKCDAVRDLGGAPVLADALDRASVAAAVNQTRPEVIVHELTALAGPFDFRHFSETMAKTNRLRREATDHLLAASQAVGVRRVIAQSYAGAGFFNRSGGLVKSEDDPLDPQPVEAARPAIEAVRHLEAAVLGADWTDGIVLRYGTLYGPGTTIRRGGEMFEAIKARKMPLIGDGRGVWSFVHIEDAAEATVDAIERGRRGIYNIVDDELAPVAEWLPTAANVVGAKRSYHLPRWLGRFVAGKAATVMMTEGRGASNAKAKRELNWEPRHASWRNGFAEAA